MHLAHSQVSTLQAQNLEKVKSLETTVTNHTTQMTALQATAITLQTTVTNQATQMTALQATATTLQTTVTNQATQVSGKWLRWFNVAWVRCCGRSEKNAARFRWR